MRLALYQPDIPQNTGTMLRMAACLGVPVDIIEPAGFDVSDRNFRRAGLDYLDRARRSRATPPGAPSRRCAPSAAAAPRARDHESGDRLTRSSPSSATDVILVGRESAGVPDEVHAAADARIVVPMRPGLRSLNVAVAAAMILGEALRQTGAFPPGAFAPAPPVP